LRIGSVSGFSRSMIVPTLLVGLVGSVAGLASGPGTAAPIPQIAFERFRLENGLEVILHEDHRIPVVAVNLWIHVGSGDEAPGKTGFAHLFEHMMFQGSKNVGEDKHFEVLRQIGATGVNGTTSYDRTNYFETVPTSQLETALWLESDRLGFLLDHVNEKSLKNQIDVVRNERRQRLDNSPYGSSRFALFEEAFPEGHPYRHLVIGKHEDLEGASLADVHAFFKTWYVPANVTLTLSGDIEPARARALVEKWFGDLPAMAKPARKVPAAPLLEENVRREVRDPFARLTRLHFAWHSPKRFAAGEADLEVLGDVLGRRGWGRLYKSLVVDKQVAQDVAAWQDGMGFSGLFHVSVTLKPGVDAREVESLVRRELIKMLERGPTEAEVRRSVVDTETNILFSLDEIMSRTESLQAFNHYLGDPGGIATYLAEVRSRTPESVRLTARRFLAKPRILIVTIPETQAAQPPPAGAEQGGAR
jgi:zinc protease